MVQIIQARHYSYDLEDKFGLQLTVDTHFFQEWSQNLLPLTDAEKQSLERVTSNYFNLTKRRTIRRGSQNGSTVSLLDLAGFTSLF